MTARASALVVLAMGLMLAACGRSGDSPDDVARQAGMQEPSGSPSAVTQTAAPNRTWSFDDLPSSGQPTGWRIEQTNPRGQGATWSIAQDATAPSGGQVLALTDPRGARASTYNLAWTGEVPFQDGRIEVKLKSGTGREDQGGGPIWRVQDKDNYYVARWNPLEDNLRLYYVEDGTVASSRARTQIFPRTSGTRLRSSNGGTGSRRSWMGGRCSRRRTKRSPELAASAYGTKADAATLFDDLSVVWR